MSCGARSGLAELGKVKVSADKLWGAPTLAWKTTSLAFGQRICVVVKVIGLNEASIIFSASLRTLWLPRI
jgi:hypothetical protein